MAKQKGGDLLGFDDDIDRLIFELDYSYSFEYLDTKTVDGAMVEAYSGLQNLVNGVSDGILFNLGQIEQALCQRKLENRILWSLR